MKPTNETGVTDSPEDIARGSLQQHGSVAWTKTPPATSGHYWVRFGSRQSMTVLEVENWHGKMQCYYYQAWRPLGDAKYWHDVEWWPSPITPPPNDKVSASGVENQQTSKAK